MKMFRLNYLFVLLMALVVMSACSKEEDNNGPEGYVKPAIVGSTKIVEVPSAIQNSQDPHLAYANSMMTMVNGYSSLTQIFANVPAGAELVSTKSTGKTWTWTSGSTTLWIEFTESLESYHWVLYMQDPQMFLEQTKIVEVTQSTLGTSGQIKIFYGYDTAIVTYSWVMDGNDLYAEILINSEGEYVLFDMDVYEDQSGVFNIYEGSTISNLHLFHCEWNASGHGSWWADAGDDPDYTGTF
jgi:hypothetical protein